MFVQTPTDNNPYWQEWAWWHWLCETDFKTEYVEARRSIERLVEHAYEGRNPTIIGHMIFMFDHMVYEFDEEDLPHD